MALVQGIARALRTTLHAAVVLGSIGLMSGCESKIERPQVERPKTEAPVAPKNTPRAKAVAFSKEQREQLAALGYATWDDIDENERQSVGVTLHREDLVSPGINYYCSESSGTVRFLDMQGRVLHSVSIDVSDTPPQGNKCKLVEFNGRGGLIMLVEDTKLVSVDFGSVTEWRRNARFHHDMDVLPDGTVLSLLAQEIPTPPKLRRYETILDNLVVTVGPGGEVIDSLSVAPMVVETPALLEKAIQHIHRTADRPRHLIDPRDFLHLNSIEAVRKEVRYKDGLTFGEGDLLFCSRYLDAIGVIDVKDKRIKWHWGPGELQWPHHASLLPDGNILLFDNGVTRGHSRILIVSPERGRIVWSYQAKPPASFFSGSRGAVQLLPNGNVLITDSSQGRVFEVTHDGDTVWEFWNTDLNTKRTARATIYRMMRLSRPQVSSLAMPEVIREKLVRAIAP